ncbi:hypothetical protein [Azotobacter beijerinckii]|uniref:hypothetical protein n=1 Tax=Azotobacter beijerinckii TaxID=170623 RepID=UPI002955CB28|nr:hypothetical protein [Azotobacter beijerinckii]MDV7210112.1 hypothetical protein [Azotobacter beijerinckii]
MSDDLKDYLGELNKAFAKLAIRTDYIPKLNIPIFRPLVLTTKQPNVLSEFGRMFKEANDRHTKMLEPFVPPEIGTALRAVPPKILEAVHQLALQSWYVSGSMSVPAMRRWGRLIQEQRFDEADEALCQYFESNLEEIETQLKNALPIRARILEAAFNAHLNGQYALSVPVFLAQADGVCEERIKASPFLRERGKETPKTATWASSSGSDMLNAFVDPLTKVYPIAYNSKERLPDFTGLNRHTVLHGEDSQYDTRVNSLKALSLLLYVENFVPSDLSDGDENIVDQN